jgi:hypothetical protein
METRSVTSIIHTPINPSASARAAEEQWQRAEALESIRDPG